RIVIGHSWRRVPLLLPRRRGPGRGGPLLWGFVPTPNAMARRFPQRAFNVREFPQVRVYNSGRALPNEEPAPSLHHKGNESARRGAGSHDRAGQLMHPALAISRAVARCGAHVTPWLLRRADEGAELH